MTYAFSDRISALKPSAIREILKVTQDPEVISFAAGNPAAETFPAEEMAEIAAEIFRKSYASALQYGVTEGYGPLVAAVSKRMREKYGCGTDDDAVIITSGAQQGVELAAKVLLNEGDAVLCESPSFIGSLNAFRSYRANLVGVPVDAGGMDMTALENALKNTPRAKFIYTIPTFQNPTGYTLTLERRREMLALAEKYDVLILEDSPYFELRYAGEYVPAIKSMDKNGRVIYLGSFSKVIAPGIRVGYAIGPKALVGKMTVAKQVSDVHTNLFFQMAVERYMARHDLDAHIATCSGLYMEKRDRMLEGLRRHCEGPATWNTPDGGLFLWMTLPEGYDGAELCRRAGQKKVAAVPGASFATEEDIVTAGVRLNFSLPSLQQIDDGTRLLGEALRGYIK
ncbi:PLP-dependent aminotransferase family protein [Oscillospiraceae bacterium OttesenSCG-928-F05]|nr:PLP-dependent aminotransferase family protein [Oscillospiraceae bacterium OttesenSCG-928-F05]